MTVINKANVPAPVLPKEVVAVKSLGGEVVVRGLLLSERTEIFLKSASSKTINLAEMLAYSVVDDKGEAIYSTEQWEEFGAKNYADAITLFKKARELSGFDVEVNKAKP